MDDPDTAAVLADRAEDAAGMSMAGFDPIRSLLSALLDAVNANTSVLIAANSKDGKVPEFTPAPRPVTEVDRVRKELRSRSRRALVALALGKDINDVD